MKPELIYAREALTPELVGEIVPLLVAHQKELETPGDAGPVDIDFDGYVMAQAAGFVYVYTARYQGELVGYIAYFVRRHMHHVRVLFAYQDLFFIRQDHRRGRAAINLLRFSENDLRGAGVDMIAQFCNVKNDITKLFGRLGYNLTELVSTKRLRR